MATDDVLMPTNEVLQVYGTQLSFADHALDFDNGTPSQPATSANSLIIGTPTEVQMNMSVIAAAAMWQSAKTATLNKTPRAWPMDWVLGACMETASAPTAGLTFDWYWNPSSSATDGTGNSGGCSGTDLTYTAAGLSQLIYIGPLVVRANVINIDTAIGTIWLPHPYGSLVVVNNSGKAMVTGGDADEIHAVLTPIIPDGQAAA